MRQFFLALAVIIVLGACESTQNSSRNQSEPSTAKAEKFSIRNDTLSIKEPWPGARRSIEYVFDEAPKRVIVTSTTHLPYLEMLGVGERLVGFPGLQYISSDFFRQRAEAGKVTDLGPDGNLNLELVYELEPDLVIAFDMGNESSVIDKLAEADIPVLYNADFLETSALGRTEWIRVFGYIFDKEQKADSVYEAIARRYDSLQLLASGAKERPTVFSGVMYGDTWYLPGGENWAAGFIEDAGGNYLWEEDPRSGWLEVSFETFFAKASDAEYWIGTSTLNSLGELQSQDDRYSEFDAFVKERVYNYSRRRNPNGGYDFFESGYARPDIVLADYIAILHPELMPDYEMYYFEPLK
jgi:iron complex transport system substrate-binding protein